MPVIAGLISVAGTVAGDAISASGQSAANAANIGELNTEMAWEQNMSNTAMTRRVVDLQRAGLNPLLAVGQGGASTPGIGAIPMQNPNASFGNLGQGVNSAISAAQQQAQTEASVNLQDAQARKATADARISESQAAVSAQKAAAELQNLQYTGKNLWDQAGNLEQDYALKGTSLEMLNRDANFQQKFLELKQQAMQYDVQAQALGMPRLENDAAWQKAHPDLAGWLSSGSAPAASSGASAIGSIVGTGSKLAGFF